MSETIRTFTIKKTVPGTVFFTLSPLSNQGLRKEVYLTTRMPQQSLPLDWALGIFLNNTLYEMYKKGVFTFNDNDGIVQAAREADETISKYILANVVDEISWEYMDAPIGRRQFYAARRKFFYILSQKK